MILLWKGILIFFLQLLFSIVRTLNTRYIVRGMKALPGSLLTSFLLCVIWLLNVAIGVDSILNGEWFPISVGYITGALLGTYLGIRYKIRS